MIFFDESGASADNEATILKWPGGKSWMAAELASLLKLEFSNGSTYVEPFLGGGSVFFNLKPTVARLSDLNSSLIDFYEVMRDDALKLIDAVWRLKNDKESYYKVRQSEPRSKIGRAARFLYLNRTCWRGIYRENRNGDFNVPYGYYQRVICRKSRVMAGASSLKNAKLVCGDFEEELTKVGAGDVVYMDPPYNIGFSRYNSKIFAWSDHLRLAAAAKIAAGRGAFLCVSAAANPEILGAFKGWWFIRAKRPGMLRHQGSSHDSFDEVILFSRKPRAKLLELTRT